MTHDVRLKATNADTGEPHIVTAAFADDEWDTLAEYLECIDRVTESAYAQSGMPRQYAIAWEAGQPPRNPHSLPPRAQLYEFLHVLRPIILAKERTSFQKITGILRRRLAEPAIRALLKHEIAAFSGDATRSVFEITVNDLPLNSEAALVLWLNAFEYHRDKDKQIEVASAYGAFGRDVVDAIFLSALVDKAIAGQRVAQLVRFLQGRQGRRMTIGRGHRSFELVDAAT